MSHLMNTYARLPVAFTHGRGAWLFAEDGSEYLDALAGIAVNGLGHAHPKLVAALAEQVGRLIHVSNIYRIAEQEELADRLCALTGMDEVFFANSGSEANEGALKLVRMYGHKHGNPEAQTIVMEHAWHGRTLATLAATGSEKARKGFDPLPSGFIRVPYNDLAAVERAAAADPRVQAVLPGRAQDEAHQRVDPGLVLVHLEAERLELQVALQRVHAQPQREVGGGAQPAQPVGGERSLVEVDVRVAHGGAERHPDRVRPEAPAALPGDHESHGAELEVREDVGRQHVDVDLPASDRGRAAHRRPHEVGRHQDVPLVARGLGGRRRPRAGRDERDDGPQKNSSLHADLLPLG